MRIPPYTLRNVVFLVSNGVPRATGFFVAVPDDEFEILVPYVVTARHCVEATGGQEFFVRINHEGGYHEEATAMDDWWLHDTEDVAAIRFQRSATSPPYNLEVESVERFIQADYHFDVSVSMQDFARMPGFSGGLSGRFTAEGGYEEMDRAPVQVGDELFLVGLLYEQPGERRNLPIARFGHIARMPEEPILMARTGGGNVPLTAYLIECHSWGGNSGSPVYWTHPLTILREMDDPTAPSGKTQFPQETNVGALLGLLSGHFDIEQEAITQGDVLGSIRTRINSGIAAVTPASAIHDLLMREDVVEDRKETAKKRREELDARRALTPDVAQEKTDEFTRSQFMDDLSRASQPVEKPPRETE